MKHLINWIEIPVVDLDRAITFYHFVFGGVEFQRLSLAEFHYAIFPTDDRFNCGALVKSEFSMPTTDGVTIYFDAEKEGIDPILTRVKNSGGQVIMEKTFLSNDAGYIGLFVDSEGNKVGLQHM
ncbi:VOC family protein [Pseudochryseolinea flava]|uniref:Glyoxalase n=1 Tax=Pseudochryseolinea flava TaxID=2059302 RepID=A0A364XUP0_9BACT|nr:VOC family protein [Pseudochryseolinea flava]RAV98039.1 glyoxalase [Pseudochryseolinea flava]